MRRTLRAAVWLALLVGCLMRAGPAIAADYPTGPIKLVVPFPPGGNIDLTARLLSKPLAEALGQAVIVVNMGGAGGLIGAGYVAKAAPDGYTLLLGSTSSTTTAPAVNKRVTFDTVKDLTALGAIQSVPLILTVSSTLPVTTFADLVAYSQKEGPLGIANSGTGTVNQLVIELMTRRTGLKAFSVPYQGSGPALTDLIGGQVQAMTDQVTTSMPLVNDGKIKVVVQLGKARSALLPSIPTMSDAGVPGFNAFTFTGLFAPAHLPPAVEARLVAALAKAMADPTLRARFKEIGAEVMEMSQPEFAAFVAADLALWRSVAHEANIVIQ